MESNRKLLPEEESLIDLLIKKSSINIPKDWRNDLLVQTMKDGDMGSLLLIPGDVTKESRLLGKSVSEFKFNDKDGIEVIVTLNLDQEGKLFELDIWKTDYSPLINLPKDSSFHGDDSEE